jgi:hypothetical protein
VDESDIYSFADPRPYIGVVRFSLKNIEKLKEEGIKSKGLIIQDILFNVTRNLSDKGYRVRKIVIARAKYLRLEFVFLPSYSLTFDCFH